MYCVRKVVWSMKESNAAATSQELPGRHVLSLVIEVGRSTLRWTLQASGDVRILLGGTRLMIVSGANLTYSRSC